MCFPRALSRSERQTALSTIWTRYANSISYDDNHYAKRTSSFLSYVNFNLTNLLLVFANVPGNLSSIPGRVIPKTFKMVLDTSLPNIQLYKVRIEGKEEQSRERRSTIPYTAVY